MRLVMTASLALGLAIPSIAHAGSYLSFGLGSESAPSGELVSDLHPDAMSVGRLAAGYRAGPIALEAGISASGLRDTADDSTVRSASASVDLKYFVGLFGPVEAYARGGLSKTWLSGGDSLVQSTGRAYDLGGGLQYTFGVLPLADASIWFDYTHRMAGLDGEEKQLMNTSADVMSLGVSVGF